jgi:abhydrolase domain-containing protein 12
MDVGVGLHLNVTRLTFADHSRVLTYAPVALAALKAFGLDEGGVIPL